MLTATYSVIALSVEQKKAHNGLSALQQVIRNSFGKLAQSGPAALEAVVNQLSRFDQYCHERKVEVYVIPAVRKVTREADPLLDELDSLASQGYRILHKVREGLQTAFDQGVTKVEELCQSIEQYCANFFKRLIKEEELVQIAQRVIPPEQWFDIAANFLSDDERLRRRHSTHSGPHP